jgi:hypothetical protein
MPTPVGFLMPFKIYFLVGFLVRLLVLDLLVIEF